MTFSSLKLSLDDIRTEWQQICLLLFIALVFVLNVLDILTFGTGSFPGLAFNFEVFFTPLGDLTYPPKIASIQFFTLLLFSIILAVLLPVLNPIFASLLVLLLAIPLIFIGLSDFFTDNIIPMQYSLLVLLMLFGTNVLLSYLSETREKQAIIDIFSRYVPPDIVREISRRPDLVKLEGELRQVSIIFCDLRDFTGISEKLEPAQLVSLLNHYFTVMAVILHKHGATIDKYIGDSIMAFWGAPLPQHDHARRSILAALEIHQAIDKLQLELAEKNMPTTDIGIGINTGMSNVGNMGSSYRLAYTVIGDAVNLSARLERLTRVYQVPTIIGESTAASVTDIAFKELDTLLVKGKSDKVKIFQPLGLKSEMSDVALRALDEHNKALEHYYAGKYAAASEGFSALAGSSQEPEYYEYMLEKIAYAQKTSKPLT